MVYLKRKVEFILANLSLKTSLLTFLLAYLRRRRFVVNIVAVLFNFSDRALLYSSLYDINLANLSLVVN
jgi:hypothetical protein